MRSRSDKSADVRGAISWIARCVCCVLVLSVILVDSLQFSEFSDPVVTTKWGSIRGKWSKSQFGRNIANFLGIPYALPPVGELRFKSPQRWNHSWTMIRDGTNDGPKCMQLRYTESNPDVLGSEDCLYLNVFVPTIPGNQPVKLPVMVYVHGGSFLTGSSDSKLYAPDYLMDKDVILVTLNYRLNILGFFSTANQVAPGNYGLKDIVAALHWVQENILSFGGDPGSVTLMGSSAGSASIHYLALSDKTKGLFHRYILHSGSALNPWAFHPHPTYRRICLELARLVGCLPTKVENPIALNETIIVASSENEHGRYSAVLKAVDDNEEEDEKMMKCMRTVDPADMLRATKQIFVWRTHPSCFITPTLEVESEDAIVTMHPWKVVKNGLFRDMPVLIEVVEDEGLVKSIDFLMNPNAGSELLENFEQYLPYLTEYQDAISNTSAFADAIENFYFNGNLTESGLMTHNITEMLGDAILIWPVFRLVQYLSEVGNADVYFSYFTYRGTFSWTFDSDNKVYYGICHADDLNYIFPLLNNMFSDLMLRNTESDRTIINIMTEMWTNFVKNGIPKAWFTPVWPNYRNQHQFIKIGNNNNSPVEVQADFLSDRMEFWEKLIPSVALEYDEDTSSFPENMITASAGTIDYRSRFNLVLVTIVLLSASF